MNESKHTPGPWRHNEFNDVFAMDAASTLVANVNDSMTNSPIERVREEADANARLIAAAPDGDRILSFLAEYVEHGAQSVNFSALMPNSETETIGEAIKAYVARATEPVKA